MLVNASQSVPTYASRLGVSLLYPNAIGRRRKAPNSRIRRRGASNKARHTTALRKGMRRLRIRCVNVSSS